MKKIFFLLLVSFTSFNAQITLQGDTYLSGGATSIVKITEGQNTTYQFGSNAIGKEETVSPSKVNRTFFEVSLNSIPTTATIQSAQIHYYTGITGYTLKLTQLSTIHPTDKSANWLSVGSSNSLHTGLQYSGQPFYSTPIKDAIQNSLSNRKVIIGALSESESTNGSATSMMITIYVTYTYPAAQLSLQARNDLEGENGGNIGMGIYPASASSQSSPYSFTAYETQKLKLEAYDNQSVNGYVWVFNDTEAPLNKSNWEKNKYGNISDLGEVYSFTTDQLTTNDNGASFVAYLKKICNISFQNNLTGIGNGGTITVNGNSVNSPTSASGVVKDNTINVWVPTIYNHNNGGLDYHFTQWSDGSSSASRTIYASQHQQYTANFNLVKPTNVGENISFGTTNGYPVKVMWAENPNSNVSSYQIWRMINNGSPTLMATVGRGVLQYEDPEFLLNTWKVGTKLSYDVRAYYSVAGTYSDPTWADVYGQWYSIAENSEAELNKAKEIPKEFSVSNYPNPFNPATTITYQLPEDGFVTLKVYDILGKEISALVNEEKSAGYYNVSFNAENLTSGIYLYSIKCNNYQEVKKMLLMK